MNVVLLFEGTENSPLTNPSAISELQYCYKVDRKLKSGRILPKKLSMLSKRLLDDKNQGQVVHLVTGSGTHDVPLAAATGSDWDVIVKEQYEFLQGLVRNDGVDVSDVKLYVFGFSRGAYQAKLFVNGLVYFGLDKTSDDFIKSIRSETKDGLRMKKDVPTVEFLGLIDTVAATTKAPKDWHYVGIPRSVKRCRHALAIHEYRERFTPQILTHGMPLANIEEQWFGGCHSDVGWAYNGDEGALADQTYTSSFGRIVMDWMLNGLQGELKGDIADFVERPIISWDYFQLLLTYTGLIHDSYNEFSNIFGRIRVRKAGLNFQLHHSMKGVLELSRIPELQSTPVEVDQVKRKSAHRQTHKLLKSKPFSEVVAESMALKGGVPYCVTAWRKKNDGRLFVQRLLAIGLRNLPALYFALRKAGLVQHDWFDDQVAFLEYLSCVIDKKVSGKQRR